MRRRWFGIARLAVRAWVASRFHNPGNPCRPTLSTPDAPIQIARREILIGLLYALVAAPGVVSSIHAVSKKTASPDSGPLTLHFPADRVAGDVYVLARQEQRRASREWEDPLAYWEFLGMARGTVTISRSERVWLELDTYATGEAGILSAEELHIPYRISVAAGASAPGDAWYAGLARFTGLRELDLRNVTILPDDLSSIESLPQLTRLWLPEPDGAMERDRLVARFIRGGRFEVGNDRPQASICLRRKPVDR